MLASTRFALVCLVLPVGLVSAACSAPPAMEMPPAPDMTWISTDPLIVARPYEQAAPVDYDAKKAYPLLVALHGHGGTAFFIDSLVGLSATVDAKQFVYAYPQALRWADGYSAWNVGSDPKGPDDMAYLDAVIGDMRERYNVDPKRIFVLGHSNGAAMAYRYGCERAKVISAIAPIAGTYSTDPMKCAPANPISVIHTQGDKDNWPGNIRETVAAWAMKNGCNAMTDSSAPKADFERTIPGAETSFEKWPGCMSGTGVELWLMGQTPHNPGFTPAYAEALLDWLVAHPKI